MKNFKYKIFGLLAIFFMATNCQDEDQEFGAIIAPSNMVIDYEIIGADAANPNGNGSGEVIFNAMADDAVSYQYVLNGNISSAPGGEKMYTFATLGLNTYSITVIAFGKGGISTSETIDVDVLSTYDPPADLITMLTGDSERVWRIKNEAPGHFGLGPVGGDFNQFYSAPPDAKEGVGMYDDRYIFNIDGTFTHITNTFNDDPVVNPDGTVFGRNVLIDELGGVGGGTPNGDDIENYPLSDYSEDWAIIAPGGIETITLTGTGFMGYYIGGSHEYVIYVRSENEMTLRSIDGNDEFDWGFILIGE
jgi:hypothetical protein